MQITLNTFWDTRLAHFPPNFLNIKQGFTSILWAVNAVETFCLPLSVWNSFGCLRWGCKFSTVSRHAFWINSGCRYTNRGISKNNVCYFWKHVKSQHLHVLWLGYCLQIKSRSFALHLSPFSSFCSFFLGSRCPLRVHRMTVKTF